MPDGFDTEGRLQIAQRGRGRGMQGFPRRFPSGRFPGFPQRFPIRRRFPGPIIYPFFFGFPPVNRCFYIDQFGRCCDRFGRCCDRFGRCVYTGGYGYPYAGASAADSWYGIEGSWDMMPDMDDMGGMAVYNDMSDYYYDE